MKKTKVSDFWKIHQDGGNREILSLLKEDSVTSTLYDTVMVFRDGMVRSHSVILASISQILKQIMEGVPEVDTKYVMIPSVSTRTWTHFVRCLLTWEDGSVVPEIVDNGFLELSDILGLSWILGNNKTNSDEPTVKDEVMEKEDYKEEFFNNFSESVCDNDDDSVKRENIPSDAKHDESPNHVEIQQGLPQTHATNECDKCKESFKDRYALKHHLYASSCSGKSQYELTAIAASLAIIEERVENKRKMYACKECNYQTKIREHMMNHCQKHTRMYCTKCEHCSKMFRDKGSLKSHIAMEHLRVKLFKCTECGNEFATTNGLSKHIKTHSDQEILKCKFYGCDFTNTNKQRMVLHVKRRHEDNKNTHLCSECGKGFVTRYELSIHMDRRHSELLHTCRICPAKYGSEKLLENHLTSSHKKIHDPRQCEQCPKLLKNIESLRKHMKIMHTPDGEKPFQCTICGKGFIKKDSWIMHMNGHQGIKPIECKQCGQHFARRTTYKRHLTIHAGTNIFTCNHCSKIFTQAYDVKRHMEKEHNSNI